MRVSFLLVAMLCLRTAASFVARARVPTAARATTRMMASFGADTPFILLARIGVKADKVDEYLALAKATDDAVRASEPGMIHHTFDQDPDDPKEFVWSELYENDAAFLAHVANPPVGEYLAQHAELGETFRVEVYGTVGAECREVMEGLGLPLKIFETKLGYSRK